jgi:hypothetical protein
MKVSSPCIQSVYGAAVGLVALGLLLVAEILGTRVLHGLSLPDYLASFASLPVAISPILFALFTTMPTLVEWRQGDRRTRLSS